MLWRQSLKPNSSSRNREFPPIYGTRQFLIAFTSALYLCLSWAKPMQSWPPPHTICYRPILILSSHLSLSFPSKLLHLCFITKTLYALLLSPIRSTCSTHLIPLHLTTRKIFGEQYNLWSSWLCCFLQSPVTQVALDPNTKSRLIIVQTISIQLCCTESRLAGQYRHGLYRAAHMNVSCRRSLFHTAERMKTFG